MPLNSTRGAGSAKGFGFTVQDLEEVEEQEDLELHFQVDLQLQ
jgi:hypothetical protein